MAGKKKETKEKPLDKMTVKELKEIAKEIPEITGVYGMNKQDLLTAVKIARGIEEAPKKSGSSSMRELKVKIADYKKKRLSALESKDAKMAVIYRRRISRLKKKTRQSA